MNIAKKTILKQSGFDCRVYSRMAFFVRFLQRYFISVVTVQDGTSSCPALAGQEALDVHTLWAHCPLFSRRPELLFPIIKE